MTAINVMFATICFLACVFYLFVLSEWMRDAKRATTRRSVDNKTVSTWQNKSLIIVDRQRAAERHDRIMGRLRLARNVTGSSRGCAPKAR